jgi:MFS family permease
MPDIEKGGGPADGRHRWSAARSGSMRLVEPWFAPFALVNGAAVGLTPILLPVVASRYGIGHVGLVMGAFNLGAFAAPAVGSLADRYRAHRLLAGACAAAAAVSLWLFPVLGPGWQLLLALADGAGFAGAVTIANLLIVERRPRSEWNPRLGSLEAVLSVGQAGALLLASWLTGLSARDGLLIGAIVPAVAIPLSLLLIPRLPAAASRVKAGAGLAGDPAAASHRLASAGRTGEWGPSSPSRAHHLAHRRPFSGVSGLAGGGFAWFLAAWIPAYAGTAILFALYPVLFQHAFGVAPGTSALAFAVIVFVSLPLFAAAGRASQRRGPAVAVAGAFGARVILLAALAAFAAIGHLPAVLPLTAFAGIMFAWSFLSVAAPDLTGQLMPNSEGDAQGLLYAASGLAGLAGSVIGGAAASSWGYPAALAIGGGAVTAGLVIFAATTMRGRGVPVSS